MFWSRSVRCQLVDFRRYFATGKAFFGFADCLINVIVGDAFLRINATARNAAAAIAISASEFLKNSRTDRSINVIELSHCFGKTCHTHTSVTLLLVMIRAHFSGRAASTISARHPTIEKLKKMNGQRLILLIRHPYHVRLLRKCDFYLTFKVMKVSAECCAVQPGSCGDMKRSEKSEQ